jgi:DNA helicase-2/ATP-dependent DNA helicase PcrA
MSTEAAAALGEAVRASLIAPAGHGKTWTLARAVNYAPPPQLILTHTHAGVHALRRHLQEARVPPEHYDVDTIAGFATRWAAAYPKTGGWDPTAADPDWDELHPAASRVLSRPQLLASVQRSYRGVLVDEYQDCAIDQHRLILALAEILPTRVVGDPLQAVYTFGSSPSVDFEADVYPAFPPLGELTTPWRWADNEALAADLQRLRAQLTAEEEPDWANYPAISMVDGRPAAFATECTRVAELGGTAVILRSHPGQAHVTASRLRGRFVSMEELQGRDIRKAAAKLDETTGPARAAALIDVLEWCTTAVVPALAVQRQRYRDGELPAVPSGSKAPVVDALNSLASTDDPVALCPAIEAARSYPDVVVYRPEILDNLTAAARRLQVAEEAATLASEVGALRDQERRSGRVLPDRVVSRTLLVKGLEFEHAVVCDLTAMNPRHTYVALTRASKSVTIVGG